LARDEPDVTANQSSLARTYGLIGVQLDALARQAEAIKEYEAAVAILRRLVEANPDVTEFQQELTWIYVNISVDLSDLGKTVEAMVASQGALAISRKLAEANPEITVFQQGLSHAYNMTGVLLTTMQKPDEALEALEAGLAIQQRLAEAHPEITEHRLRFARFYNNISDLHRKQHRAAEACAGYDRALAIKEPLVRENPTNTWYREHLAVSLWERGQARLDLGDNSGAAGDTRRSLDMWDAMSTRDAYGWFATACCHAVLSALAGRDGSGILAADGPAEADRALALVRKAISVGYRNPAYYRIEPALDSLRERDDFQELMRDLAFPATPFAR
jgi:tetratricopeptide (TPR) repeat protein